MPTTETRLRDILQKLTGYAGEVAESTLLREDMNMDSVDLVELFCAIESEFGIEISDDTINEMNTFGDLLAYFNDSDPGAQATS